MKKTRHQKILELINERPINTQDELLDELKKSGFDVTQSTISRDMRGMRIVKALDGDGNYRYTSTESYGAGESMVHFPDIFISSAIAIDYAINNVIIKCHSGMASGACAALDSMNWPSIVGTLAGDDTILIITRTEEAAKELAGSLNEMINR